MAYTTYSVNSAPVRLTDERWDPVVEIIMLWRAMTSMSCKPLPTPDGHSKEIVKNSR